MTKPAQTDQRKTFVVFIAVFMLIAAYWTVRAISHQPPLEKPKTSAELVDELKTFDLPGNTQQEGTIGVLQGNPTMTVVAHYKSESDCQTLSSYYKNEFHRHNFQPQHRTDENPKPELEGMSFYRHGTWGTYACLQNARGSYYLLSLRPLQRAE